MITPRMDTLTAVTYSLDPGPPGFVEPSGSDECQCPLPNGKWSGGGDGKKGMDRGLRMEE